MKSISGLTGALAALAIVGSASVASAAVTITVNNQGLKADGVTAVDAVRSIEANMFDNVTSTMFSLGIGGSITASIAPALIASASVLELTNGNNSDFPESMEVYLGTGTGGTLLGELFNLASGVATTSTGTGGSSITVLGNTPSTGVTSFLINLGSNVASALTFLDTTGVNGYAGTTTKDGFDIAELRIAAVPLPAAGLVLLTALGGLGGAAAYRRRKAA